MDGKLSADSDKNGEMKIANFKLLKIVISLESYGIIMLYYI